MNTIANREQQHAWELRSRWIDRREVVIRIDSKDVPRLRGTVEYVSVTGAFARILPAGETEPWDVTCASILTIRSPHFSEPADVVRVVRRRIPGVQLPLWEGVI